MGWRRGWTTFVGILADGGRVLARQWPQLVVLFLAGAALRLGVLWLAVEAGVRNPLAGILLMPLAPLVTLLSLVFMMSAATESFPSPPRPAAPRSRTIRGTIRAAGEVTIPFLAVYAAQGLLWEDTLTYLVDGGWWSRYHEVRPTTTLADYATGWQLAALVVGALVIRKAITSLGLATKSSLFALVGAYVEVMWLVTLVNAARNAVGDTWRWFASRTVVVSVRDAGVAALTALGEWAAPVVAAWQGLWSFGTSLWGLLALPIAWLVVGAAIVGAAITRGDWPTHEGVSRRLARLPGTLRRAGAQVAEPVATPLLEAWHALRRIAAAGWVPIGAFCAVFVLVGQLRSAVAWLVRLAVGPRDLLLQFSLQHHVELLERLVYFPVLVALVAAAVHRVARLDSADEPAAGRAPDGGLAGPPATDLTEPPPAQAAAQP